MSLPKTCPLPKQYLKTQEEEFFVGLPFWEMDRPYPSFADVPVGEKGNNCLGCEPGSGPGPFIVVYNDDKQMGFIYPYVTVINRDEPKSEQMCDETTGSFQFPGDAKNGKKRSTVTVQIGGDTLQKDESKFKEASSEYEIQYITHEEIRTLMKQMCCFNFGSFGNCALPNHSDPVKLDGYFFCT